MLIADEVAGGLGDVAEAGFGDFVEEAHEENFGAVELVAVGEAFKEEEGPEGDGKGVSGDGLRVGDAAHDVAGAGETLEDFEFIGEIESGVDINWRMSVCHGSPFITSWGNDNELTRGRQMTTMEAWRKG